MAVALGGSHGDIPMCGCMRGTTAQSGRVDTVIPHFHPYSGYGPSVSQLSMFDDSGCSESSETGAQCSQRRWFLYAPSIDTDFIDSYRNMSESEW